MIFCEYFSVFYMNLVQFLILSSDGKPSRSFVYVSFHCVGGGISTMISISNWSDPYIFRRKMKKTRSGKENMDGEVFISRQNRHISFVIIMIKVIFPTLYLDLVCKPLCFPPTRTYK